jgi:hypothetical protein
MTDILRLAERCEQATGPDRELDQAIELTLPGVLPHPDMGRFKADDWAYVISGTGHPDYEPGQGYASPRYTASLDAAMTLVPDGCREWHCGRNIKTGKGQAYLLDPATMRTPIYVHGETPALALCAAALRARAEVAA